HPQPAAPAAGRAHHLPGQHRRLPGGRAQRLEPLVRPRRCRPVPGQARRRQPRALGRRRVARAPLRSHRMEGPTYPGSDAPQLRTILMNDLCDSTAVVERLGDIAAASLFREHDPLVGRLQQQWRGSLIDRSDGLLLVFERPVDGLGFALDYQRSRGPLGRAHGVQLRARAGLHVGEVVSWANDEEAVRHGAKPLEIEGLAKPLAARLMALANPGQILLSHVAETLARRAASELGPGLGRALVWKSHGRWHFKGLPEPLEIHEAGEEGIADMAPPRPADG